MLQKAEKGKTMSNKDNVITSKDFFHLPLPIMPDTFPENSNKDQTYLKF